MQAFDCIAIGSLPHTDVEKAMELVKSNFSAIPFWPQLPKLNENENILAQFTEGMHTDAQNYAITYAAAFEPFIELVKETKPAYAKGQIVGPFTLAAALTGKDVAIIVKTLALKAIWQIKKIKEASPQTTPIIFIDEPSISRLDTPADIKEMLSEVSDVIQNNGGLSGFHCCGNFDWSMPISVGVDIISFDAYSYAHELSLFSKDVEKFLASGGKIAWGVVPTFDIALLQTANLDKMLEVFEQAVNYLTKKGIDEKMILDNSLITSSCGTGALSEELAQHAVELTRELSERLKNTTSP